MDDLASRGLICRPDQPNSAADPVNPIVGQHLVRGFPNLAGSQPPSQPRSPLRSGQEVCCGGGAKPTTPWPRSLDTAIRPSHLKMDNPASAWIPAFFGTHPLGRWARPRPRSSIGGWVISVPSRSCWGTAGLRTRFVTPGLRWKALPQPHMHVTVELRTGAVAHSASLRFPSPLIKPNVPISGIRLSDWFHRKAHGVTDQAGVRGAARRVPRGLRRRRTVGYHARASCAVWRRSRRTRS